MTEFYVMYITTAFECKWCRLAKDLLDVYGKDYIIKDIHTNKEYLAEFKEEGHKTVPQIYKEGIHIGGYEDTKYHLRISHSPRAAIEMEIEKFGDLNNG